MTIWLFFRVGLSYIVDMRPSCCIEVSQCRLNGHPAYDNSSSSTPRIHLQLILPTGLCRLLNHNDYLLRLFFLYCHWQVCQGQLSTSGEQRIQSSLSQTSSCRVRRSITCSFRRLLSVSVYDAHR